ncbi:MAG: DUF1501 domain-containing protein [Pirellulales bacterium]|nr:DUF1501 domain-containing protein [Pirellulales bacterium]
MAKSHHCGRFVPHRTSRRELLQTCAGGFGALALATLWAEQGLATETAGDNASLANLPPAATGNSSSASPWTAKPPHYAARAKSVILLYMDGGPSAMDTFNPKPLLTKENGQDFKMKKEPTQFDNNGQTLGSPWKFAQHGESGHWFSDLFPHLAKRADDLAFVHSLTSSFSEHTSANYFMHTGSGLQGRPSVGAWVGYGLGSETQNLPGFVVINGGLIPPGGLDCFGSGFLPASYQGSIFLPARQPVANISPRETQAILQQNKLALVKQFDRRLAEKSGANDPLESAIANAELAYHMQDAVPAAVNWEEESAATAELYGLNAPYEQTKTFARECLMARRLVERGVRFIELTCPNTGNDRWDAHGGLKGNHENNSRAVDQPIYGLLTDLKSRGLLDSTLVVWMGEFGRTPFAQGSDGRDHNPYGFTMWLAGGGIKGGVSYGQTDEYGYKAIENKLVMHDLHATMLHLLGLDHTRLTFRFSGRDFRLTDVHGHVVKELLA